MKYLEFLGHSDDIFEAAGDEYYSPYAARVKASDGSLVVRAFYGCGHHNEGVWCVGIEPDGEDCPIPNWPVTFKLSPRGYSTVLTICAPEDVIVTNLAP